LYWQNLCGPCVGIETNPRTFLAVETTSKLKQTCEKKYIYSIARIAIYSKIGIQPPKIGTAHFFGLW
jgi:hypothetical protein